MSKHTRRDFPLHAPLLVFGLLTFYPYIFTLITSFKSTPQFQHNFWGVSWPLQFVNYKVAVQVVGKYVVNSLLVSGVTVAGVLLVSSITAFVFARYAFPGREFFFLAVLSLLMIPGILTLVPAFILVKDLGLLNTYWGLIVPWVSGGQVFAIFLLRNFMSSLPEELFEAARIDGATLVQSFFRIAIPLSRPILITVAIMNIISTWGDYVWPLITITDGKMWPVSVGIQSFSSRYMGLTQYGPMFAGFVVASVPLIVLFVFTMPYYVAGLTSGAIKA